MRVICLIVVLGLTACGDHQETKAPPPMPISDTVFAPTVNALDKARAVQGTLQQDKDNADAALKAAE